MKPFGEEFGWSRAEVSLGITIGSIGGGLLGPIMGPLIDRTGSRLVLVLCQIIYGSCLFSLTFLGNSLPHFLLAYGLGRMVVQGGASLATQVAISNWFIRLRGRAMGLSALGTRIGQAILPALVALIVEVFGWRYSWLFLGLTVWGLAIVPSLLFFQRRPEDLGLLPDGDPAPDADLVQQPEGPQLLRSALEESREPRWTLRQALGSRSLWFLTLASSQSYFLGAGINLHLYPYLTDIGLSVPEAIAAASAFFAVAGVSAVVWGVLLDRFPLQYCMATAFSVASLGIVLLLFTSSFPLALMFALVYGLSFSGIHTAIQVMWATYFGRTHVGAITGMTLPLQLLTNAMGPLFGGWMYDRNRSYTAAFAVYAALAGIATLWALAAGAPQSRPGGTRAATTFR